MLKRYLQERKRKKVFKQLDKITAALLKNNNKMLRRLEK